MPEQPLTSEQLVSFQALRDDIRQKLRAPTYADPKMGGWHHQRFLRVEVLLDESDQLQKEVERLQAILNSRAAKDAEDIAYHGRIHHDQGAADHGHAS